MVVGVGERFQGMQRVRLAGTVDCNGANIIRH